MDRKLMHNAQGSSDPVWILPTRTSTTLPSAPGARVLQLCAGRLWLTTAGDADHAPLDLWLVPGDSLTLPAGLEAVIEAWPSARFQLLVPPSSLEGTGPAARRVAQAAAWLARRTARRRLCPA